MWTESDVVTELEIKFYIFIINMKAWGAQLVQLKIAEVSMWTRQASVADAAYIPASQPA